MRTDEDRQEPGQEDTTRKDLPPSPVDDFIREYLIPIVENDNYSRSSFPDLQQINAALQQFDSRLTVTDIFRRLSERVYTGEYAKPGSFNIESLAQLYYAFRRRTNEVLEVFLNTHIFSYMQIDNLSASFPRLDAIQIALANMNSEYGLDFSVQDLRDFLQDKVEHPQRDLNSFDVMWALMSLNNILEQR
jgi:hypothetical protein